MTFAETKSADGQFSISSRRLDRGILVVLSGDVDLATARVVEAELTRAEASEDLVVLDLSQVSFMDSTGMRMIVWAHQRLRKSGGSLEIVHLPTQVKRLFELVGILDHLNISDRSVDPGAAPEAT